MKSLNVINNFIYLYHTNEWLLLPEFPEQLTDTMSSTFAQNQALSRTAPYFTYSNSGPRRVQVQLHLHRDMLYNMNYGVSNFKIKIGEDYIDQLLGRLRAINLPKFDATKKGVTPPMIALRIGNELFIKGVVDGQLSTNSSLPILDNGKYSQVTISFEVSEVEEFDAESIGVQGSFRGITQMFVEGLTNRGGTR